MELLTTARNASLQDIVDLLRDQNDVKYDIVTPAATLTYDDAGDLTVEGGGVEITSDGVTDVPVTLQPTVTFEDGISQRLDIPRGYLRRMRESSPELLARNVNHWLRQEPDRRYFIRGYRLDDPHSRGIARAILSDRYRVVDNFDVLMAALAGVKAAGVPMGTAEITSDLSEQRMRVKIRVPEVSALAPVFLRDYRSPFTGQTGRELPVIEAGLVISNSEVGAGAFTIAPHITVRVCKNGMTRKVDTVRKVHLGERLDVGTIEWSDETLRRINELVTAQTRDAVQTFLSHSYISRVAAELDEKADARLARPTEAIENVCKQFKMTEEEQASILSYFVGGADPRAVGVMQAVTAYASVIDDPDRAAELEEASFDILDAATREELVGAFDARSGS